MTAMVAVVPVRSGALPLGADEAVAEAGGRVVLVGDGARAAADDISVDAPEVRVAEAGPYRPGAWAEALAPLLAADDVVVLPASPDGRDLAPRLAHALGRPLLAGAVLVTAERVLLARRGGLVEEEHAVVGPVVATLVPGARGAAPGAGAGAVVPVELALPDVADAELVELSPPDPATMDLSEASRIVAGGAGLRSEDAFRTLERVALAMGASYGASRVVADAGWVPQDRFIGTTGVTVDPRVYVALGISGAVQHVTGLGTPEHIVSVNVDASCPMMTMADVAIVTDAPAMLAALATRLGVDGREERDG